MNQKTIDNKAIARIAGRIAWRYRWRLSFFSLCIAIGIAFLFCISTLLDVISGEVTRHAQGLLGADIEVSSYRAFNEDTQKVLEQQISRENAKSTDITWFPTMLRPIKQDGEPFLVSVKAIEPAYPLYGELRIDPPHYATLFFEEQGCLIARTIAIRHGLKVGDAVRVAEAEFAIAGIIDQEPGRMLNAVSLAPRVMIPKSAIAKTGVEQFGSRVLRSRLIALTEQKKRGDVLRVKKILEDTLTEPHLRITTYQDTQNNLRELFQRQSTFFFLVSLITLLVGAVGMGASITTFLNEQLETVATLRCVGIGPRGIFRLYFLLCLAIGLLAGLLGCLFGSLFSAFGLDIIKNTLAITIDLPFAFHWHYFGEAFAIACLLTMAINFYKLHSIARIAPLDILRGKVEKITTSPWQKVLTFAVVTGSFWLYAVYKADSWTIAGYFVLILVATIALTMLLILGCLQLATLLLPFFDGGRRAIFLLRHGLRQFVRHKSRTLVFLLSLIIGFSLIQTLNIIHHSLVEKIQISTASDSANIFLADVQKHQQQGVAQVADRYTSRIDFAPLIRARLTHINGQKIRREERDKLSPEEQRRYRSRVRAFNLTYKDTLNSSENIIDGKFWEPGEQAFHISLEEGFGNRAGLKLGDLLQFDIQGRAIDGRITSIRKIDWLSMKPNFFVVMPNSVIGDFPQTIIASLRIETPQKIADFQTQINQEFPNVSVIDVTKIIDTVQTLLGYFLTALRITAWFCVAVGLLILVGTFSVGHRQRIDQVALLRAMGGTKSTIAWIDFVEFAMIGLFTAIIAGTISYILSQLVAQRMKIEVYWSMARLGEIALMIVVPLIVGLLVNWRTYGTTVMDNLRREI